MTIFWSLTDWRFWLAAIEFGLVIGVCWYLPGRWLLSWVSRTWSKTAPVHALSLVVGLVLWTVLAYGLGWLQQRWLLPVIAIGLAGLELWQHQSWKGIVAWRTWRISALEIVLILGLCIQLPAVFGSGLWTDRGVGMYFTNAQDGMMHLTYIQDLIEHFPPRLPEAAGLALTNYHYLGDLATAELGRVFGLPITHLFFQYLPVMLSLITGYLLFGLIQAWGGSRRTGYFGLFFWYLGGDFDYVVAWILHRDWHWYAAAIDNGADQFLNQPQTFAKVIFLAGLWLLTYYWQHRKPWAWWLTLLLFGAVVGFKVYFGLFALGALGLATLWRTWQRQSNWVEWIGLVAAGVLSAAIYLPANHAAGGLSYVPLGWPKLLLGVNHLDWREWWLRQQVYEAAQNWRNVAILNTVAVGVALVTMYGTRCLGWWGLARHLPKRNRTSWAWFWWPMSLVFVFLGLNTMQDPGGFNTFNFIVVTTVPLIIGCAFQLDAWLQQSGWRRWVGIGLVGLIMMTTVPRSLRNAAVYWQATIRHEAGATFSPTELELFAWVDQHTPSNAIIQTLPQNVKARQSSFLAFFTHRQTFLTSTEILETHGFLLPERKAVLKIAALVGTYTGLTATLKSTNVSYLYVENLAGQREFLQRTDMIDHVVFSNAAGWIIQL